MISQGAPSHDGGALHYGGKLRMKQKELKMKVFAVLTACAAALLLSACGAAEKVSEAADKIEATVKEEWTPLPELSKEATIEETVIYNDNDVRITANSLKYGGGSVYLNLTFENNSSKELEFIAESMGHSCNSVNRYMIENGYVNCKVPAGGTGTDEAAFRYDELSLYGFPGIAEIQIGFEVEDDDYNRFYTGPLTIKTSLADSYDFNTDTYRKTINNKALKTKFEFEVPYFSEDVIYSSAGFSIISELMMVNKDGDRVVMLEFANDTDSPAAIKLKDIKANDVMIYDGSYSYDTINPHTKALVSIRLDRIKDAEEWKALGIGDIKSVGFHLNILSESENDLAEPMDVTIPLK